MRKLAPLWVLMTALWCVQIYFAGFVLHSPLVVAGVVGAVFCAVMSAVSFGVFET